VWQFDFSYLKKHHQPRNKDAVPILKQKKNFSINRGEVKFQRIQFPLTLAYAITAYKCQGETLEEVVIDFSHEPGERGNIQWGSFYVALTRVKEGKNVYLKNFCKSYITFNEKVERKIEAMKKFKPYQFKKIYLSEAVFKDSSEEVKLGYFNIRGFLESNHAEYIDHDMNLLNLHFLVISETWLGDNTSNKTVIEKLNNWRIIKRLDATDGQRHMGLLLLTPSHSNYTEKLIYDLDYVEGYTERRKAKSLLYQGLVMNLKCCYKKIVFIYIRETPSEIETIQFSKRFSDYDCIMGDLNLNPEIREQKARLKLICGNMKTLDLEEFTTINKTQLDHIILDKDLADLLF
jgi:hypothetical protein